MKPSALVVAVFLLLLNFPAVADRKALVVGIDEFQNPKVRPLACCVNDAGAYRDLLIGGFGFRSEEIRFLTNGEATREGILASLNALAAPFRGIGFPQKSLVPILTNGNKDARLKPASIIGDVGCNRYARIEARLYASPIVPIKEV